MAEYKVVSKEVTSVVWRDVQKAAQELGTDVTPVAAGLQTRLATRRRFVRMKTVGSHAATCATISTIAAGHVAPSTLPGSSASGIIETASATSAIVR